MRDNFGMRASGVYEIVCLPTGKRYIGSAKDFEHRWKAHRFHLGKGSHHSRHLQAAWNKHGADAFAFRAMIVCEPRHMVMYEQIMIDGAAPAFNIAPFAGSCLGVKHTPETREKQRVAKLGNKHTLGYRHRPESIAKLSASKLGNTYTKGKTRDPAAVAATAAAHRGMKRSAETCARIAEKAIGRVRSPESIEKSAAKLRGRPLSPEHAAKLIGNRHAAGLKHTDEWKAAASERQKGVKRPKDAAYRAKISAALKGRRATSEARANQSAAQRGKKRGPYKKRPPAEQVT
ncbi:MAG: GIY-YIG nuclease family protein [Betaproteobacteria bacterium]|nr:GIY-YIG nuclease family protein [Betaproteobacteria bacterium]